ncbi:hypothetical protein DOTSEDRAFT_74783 [Dothistroma septosporum NZE10]|uniref:Uncharacterized protein n=1 Tax=Dothistroma septosporum (strain NZE10 / CBS 128990) TaxID=675120 RepID=N1PCK9_DOTSN|nr:hypothetical protein DOTSEDRAFT_74783 [Dothistroma septosporum NZE10]
MPCRALSICRQATAPSRCLWITDDVLAEAWSRFARVVNAASKRRCEGRRYGSNIPGPLEAHRRLSKRRMGVAAVAAGGPPIGADFAALFGIGSFKPEQRNDGWKWEAPQLDRRKHAKTKTDTGWFGPYKTTQEDAWDSFLQPPAFEEDAPDVQNASQLEVQAVEKSKAEFRVLLTERVNLEHVAKYQLTEVLDFLQSAADEPKAGNLMALLDWLAKRGVSGSAASAIVLLVKEKVELGTCVDDLARILAALLQHIDFRLAWDDVAKVLQSVNPKRLGDICIDTTRELVSATLETSGAYIQALTPAEKVWLHCLRSCEQLDVWHSDSPIWRGVYDVLVQHVQKPSMLASHFLTLHRLDLSRVMLRHWAGTAKAAHPSGGGQDEVTVSMIGFDKNLNFRQSPHDVDMDAVLRDFDAARAARYGRSKDQLHTSSPFVDMLDVARRYGLRHDWLCEELFDILMHSPSATSVQKVSWELRCHKDLGLTLRTAQRLVHYFLRHDKMKFAYSLFRAVPTLSLLHVHELPIKLAHAGTIGGSDLWLVLQRQIMDDFVKVHDRDAQSPELTLTPEHVDLIHLVAHAFAHSPALTTRVAFRRVWQCYLFLRDRRAPINPLLTRSLVQAGVTRSLKALERPSTEQFRFILSIVARIEGPETAEKLDRTVYRYWTERVRPRLAHFSRGVDFALGMSGDAVVERRAAWYNLRSWSRDHRPWLLSKKADRSPKLTSAKKTTRKPPALLNYSETWSLVGPDISAGYPVEMSARSTRAAVPTDHVPFRTFAEKSPSQRLPTRCAGASKKEDDETVRLQPVPNSATRRSLGYRAPQSVVSSPEPPIRSDVESAPALAAQLNTERVLGTLRDASVLSKDPTTITDVTLQQAAYPSLASATSAEDFIGWLDSEDAEQSDAKTVIAVAEVQTPELTQQRLPLGFEEHHVSELIPQVGQTANANQNEDQKYIEEAAGWNPSSRTLEAAAALTATASNASSTHSNLGKLMSLSVEEKQSLEMQGVCVRCRQPGHRAADARCSGHTWRPSSLRSVQPSEPDSKYLEWRQETSGEYILWVRTDDEWLRYSRVHGRVRQMRRWAKKTGRAHSERDFELFEKWGSAQEEMAKRQAALERVSRATVFPA